MATEALAFLRGGSFYYYFTYFVDSTAMGRFLDGLGLVGGAATQSHGVGYIILDAFGLILREGADPSKVGFSLFLMAGSLVNIIGVLLAKPLADRFGKKVVFTVGLAGAALVQAVYVILNPEDVGLMFILTVLSSLCYGPTIPLLWAMIADTADYSEWKNGRRATGFVYAGIVFALKAGLGLGGAFTGWVLAAYGYEVATARTPEVLQGIRMMASVYSAIPFGLGVVCMLFYPISKALNLQIGDELAERRRKEAAGRTPSAATS